MAFEASQVPRLRPSAEHLHHRHREVGLVVHRDGRERLDREPDAGALVDAGRRDARGRAEELRVPVVALHPERERRAGDRHGAAAAEGALGDPVDVVGRRGR